MSALSVMQSAAIRLVGEKPTAFFSATGNTLALEFTDLINEVAKDIAKSHDWQALINLHTITGDGTTTEFAFPADYERMLVHAEIIDTNFSAWGYDRITDINQWIFITERGIQALPGNWILFGNEFRFVPAPVNLAEATFPYIKNTIVNGGTATDFTSDSDTFDLSERLLTLGLIWRWRQQKRLDYAADQGQFVKLFNELAGRDKGSRIFRTGPARFPASVSISYPFNLGS